MSSENQISTDVLSSLALFSELSLDELKEISSIGSVQKMKKSKIIFREGEVYKGFYILLKGSVKVSRFSSEGKETILHLIKPRDTFGDIPLFEGGNYPVNSYVLSDSELLFIPQKEFLEFLQSNKNICFKMLVGFAKRLRILTKKVEELTTLEITNRLALYLYEEIKRIGTDKLPEPYLKLTVPKKNIASYLGTITETLSRTFKKLQDENIIKVSGKTIYIKDLSKLKKIAS